MKTPRNPSSIGSPHTSIEQIIRAWRQTCKPYQDDQDAQDDHPNVQDEDQDDEDDHADDQVKEEQRRGKKHPRILQACS